MPLSDFLSCDLSDPEGGMSVWGSRFPVQSVGRLELGAGNVPMWLFFPDPVCVTRAALFGPVLSSFVPSSGVLLSCQGLCLPGSGIRTCSSPWRLSGPNYREQCLTPFQITRPPQNYMKLSFPLILHFSKFNIPSSSKHSL